MQTNNASQSSFFNPRVLIAFTLSLIGALLTIVSFASPPSSASTELPRDSVYVDHRGDSLSANAAAAAQWSSVVSPDIGSTDVLLDVTCVSASDCWAVGYYIASGNKQQTLVEHWDGIAWSIVTSPNTSPTRHNILNAVTCVSASDCWAVGYDSLQTLIEHWDGTAWTIVTSPSPPLAVLFDVTCVSASDCWAVGARFFTDLTGPRSEMLIRHWDGDLGVWTEVSAPNDALGFFLTGVTCVSATDCWAIGNFLRGIVETPSIDPCCEIVPCVNSLSCVIRQFLDFISPDVGGTFSFGEATFARWNGTSWSLSPPNVSLPETTLLGVTCVSASDCWAVGYLQVNTAFTQTLIEHWNGSAWTVVPTPVSNPSEQNLLQGVACVSASDCWAVGYYNNDDSNLRRILIEQWNGTSWAIPAPNNGGTFNTLNAVTCVSASDCWAVGSIGAPQTLIMRYAPSPPLPTNVVSRKTHGAAGHFDIDLPGIECRSGGANENYQIVFTFLSAVTVSGAAATPWTDGSASIAGPPSISPNGKRVTVNLTDVSNAQTLTVTLTDVNDGTNSGNVAVPVSVLLGDTTGDGAVNSSDISETKSHSGQTAPSSNFRTDVTVSGTINSSDIGLVKSKSGTALP